MNGINGASPSRKPGTALMKQPAEYVTPGADVFETETAFLLRIDLPGAVKESINVFLDGDLLTVRAPIVRLYGDNATLLVQEIVRTNYYRIFNLGRGVDREGVDAEYEEGVLTIRVPKSGNTKIREIPIH